MKKLLLIFAVSIIFLFHSLLIQAQKMKHPFVPKWVSEKGSWVIESNIKNPYRSVVYFYSNGSTLVYKEQIDGVMLNLRKKKVLLHLKHILEQTVTAWEQNQISTENQMLLATAFKK